MSIHSTRFVYSDKRLGRIVAIQQLTAPDADRLDREPRAMAVLNHPHICQWYDRPREATVGMAWAPTWVRYHVGGILSCDDQPVAALLLQYPGKDSPP